MELGRGVARDWLFYGSSSRSMTALHISAGHLTAATQFHFSFNFKLYDLMICMVSQKTMCYDEQRQREDRHHHINTGTQQSGSSPLFVMDFDVLFQKLGNFVKWTGILGIFDAAALCLFCSEVCCFCSSLNSRKIIKITRIFDEIDGVSSALRFSPTFRAVAGRSQLFQSCFFELTSAVICTLK